MKKRKYFLIAVFATFILVGLFFWNYQRVNKPFKDFKVTEKEVKLGELIHTKSADITVKKININKTNEDGDIYYHYSLDMNVKMKLPGTYLFRENNWDIAEAFWLNPQYNGANQDIIIDKQSHAGWNFEKKPHFKGVATYDLPAERVTKEQKNVAFEFLDQQGLTFTKYRVQIAQ